MIYEIEKVAYPPGLGQKGAWRTFAKNTYLGFQLTFVHHDMHVQAFGIGQLPIVSERESGLLTAGI